MGRPLCTGRTKPAGTPGARSRTTARGHRFPFLPDRLFYTKGMDLSDREAATPIGAGCKVCGRTDCAQRAFPAIGRSLTVDEAVTRFAPYQAKG